MTDTEIDALRYRWIKQQTNFDLRTTKRTKWIKVKTGKEYYPTHNLDVNGTGFAGIEHLDDLIDQAMSLYPFINETKK